MKPRTEPVAVGAAVIGLVQAILVVLAVLDIVVLSGEQQAAISGAVTAAVALVGAVVVRRQVTPTAQAEQATEAAVLAAVAQASETSGASPDELAGEVQRESPRHLAE